MDKITFREIDRKLPTGKSKRKKIPITYKVGLFFSYLYIFANKVKKNAIAMPFIRVLFGENLYYLIEINNIKVICITAILFFNCIYRTSLSLSYLLILFIYPRN